MKRSMQKIVFGLALGAMLMPSFYAFAKTEMANTAGQWRMEEKYWTFLNEQGEKLKGWIVSNGEWYFLDKNGNLKTGWHEENGKWYFFNTEMGAKTGSLLTGWHWVEGYCYYFAETDNSTYGTLFVNGTTPDGYRVNHIGQWVNEKGEAYYIGGKGISSTHIAGASRSIPGEAAFSRTVAGAGRGPVASSGGASFGTAFPGKAGGNVGGTVSKPESDEKKPVVEERKEEEKPVVEEKKEDEKKPVVEEKKEDIKPLIPEDSEEKKAETEGLLDYPKNLVLQHRKNQFYELHYLYFGKRKYTEEINAYIQNVSSVEINGMKYEEFIFGDSDGDGDLAEKKKTFSKIADGPETVDKVNALALTVDQFKDSDNDIVIHSKGYKDYRITLKAK